MQKKIKIDPKDMVLLYYRPDLYIKKYPSGLGIDIINNRKNNQKKKYLQY